MKKRRVALVLAGGGARGVAHIGAIEVENFMCSELFMFCIKHRHF